MKSNSYIGLTRINLNPVNFPNELQPSNSNSNEINHVLDIAWKQLKMTVAGNTIWKRSFFLAHGCFPNQSLFKRYGGEDGALGIATTHTSIVATIFDNPLVSVNHIYHKGIHAEKLIKQHLKQINNTISLTQINEPTEKEMQQANLVTNNIIYQVQNLNNVTKNNENITGIKTFFVNF